jgi:hypothetical protein
MAVHPRRQFWTSYSPPWELEISQCLIQFLTSHLIHLRRVYLVRKYFYVLLWFMIDSFILPSVHTTTNWVIDYLLLIYNRLVSDFIDPSSGRFGPYYNPWRYSSDEPWPAEQPPLAVFPDYTRRYWVDMWPAHRIPQLHFQLSKPDRYFFIQVTTQFIRSQGWVDPDPDPTPSEKS